MESIACTIKQAVLKNKKKLKILHFIKNQTLISLGHICVFWQILFFYTPIIFLIYKGFKGIFLSHIDLAIVDFLKIEYAFICLNSIKLCLITTLSTLILGFTIAYILAFHIKKYKNFILLLIIIPFWTNFALHMYSWFYILQPSGPLNSLLKSLNLISNPINLVNSKFSVYLMMCYYYLPFMVISIYTSFEQFDFKLIEASKNLGAKSITTFFKILLPLNMKGIQTGIFLVLIPSFGEFIIPEMMGGDKTYFIGNIIALYVLNNKTQYEGIILTFLSLTLILIIAHLINKMLKKISLLISGESI